MQQDHFFTFAVGAGFLLIGLVFYAYLRPKPEHRPAVTALLGLLGFALIASPNWTRISIRSDGLELSLLREIEGRQLRALGALRETLHERGAAPPDLRSEPPSSPSIRPRRGDPQRRGKPDAEREEPPEDGAFAAGVLATGSGRPADRLLDAYERGELDLSALSDAELLDLSEYITARKARAPRPAP